MKIFGVILKQIIFLQYLKPEPVYFHFSDSCTISVMDGCIQPFYTTMLKTMLKFDNILALDGRVPKVIEKKTVLI